VAVPVTAIVAVNADEVILNIDKEAIEALPTASPTPVQ
jgi:hypothetical protein